MLELIDLEKAGSDSGVGVFVTLAFDKRQRSRLRVRLDNGCEAAVLLAPGTRMAQGDVLCSADGSRVGIRAAREPVSTALADDPVLLARACYHLGNRHVALQIGIGWLRYQPDHVLDELLRSLGLTVTHDELAFEPEPGAYSHTQARTHTAGDAHGHTHGDRH